MSAGGFHPGDVDEGPLPDLPQRGVGDTLPVDEQTELLAIREARRVDAERAAERARRGESAGGIY